VCAEPLAPLKPGTIATLAGNGKTGDLPPGGGAALTVPIDQPFGMTVGPDGALYIAAVGQNRVLRLDLATGQIKSVAGIGRAGYSGDGGPATEAALRDPYEICFDRRGNMFFVEMANHLVRRVDARTGRISTVAGSGQMGFGGDGGPAAKAVFQHPHSIAIDADDVLYVADIGNHRIRRIDPKTGTIESIAGDGTKNVPQDGVQARGQPLRSPRALFVSGRTLWIALREGNSVWRLNLDTGLLNHVAGKGAASYTGDNGPAADATFSGPKGIVATKDGMVYVVDTENQAIREIDTTSGKIRSVAGAGPQARGFGGDDGPGLLARMNRPHGICLLPDGTLAIGDTENNRVRRVRVGERRDRK